jgi:tRNA (cmo5U34)-methyltransferase
VTRDTVEPGSRWAFDEQVTEAFDDMLERSIPEHDIMRDLVFRVGRRFLKKNYHNLVADLGCSRGGALERFASPNLPDVGKIIGLEVSDPMIRSARSRFRPDQRVSIRNHDLRDGLPEDVDGASVILSVLTLQFTPIEHRQRIVRESYERLRPGGALLLVEKVLGDGAGIDSLMVAEYYDEKRRNGYTQEQIERKRLSLEGVLVPVTARWNEELLRRAGFADVDCFWRHLNFAGWLAVK